MALASDVALDLKLCFKMCIEKNKVKTKICFDNLKMLKRNVKVESSAITKIVLLLISSGTDTHTDGLET